MNIDRIDLFAAAVIASYGQDELAQSMASRAGPDGLYKFAYEHGKLMADMRCAALGHSFEEYVSSERSYKRCSCCLLVKRENS